MNLEYPGYDPDEPTLFDELVWTELDSPAPIEPLQHGLENNSEYASASSAQPLDLYSYQPSDILSQEFWGHGSAIPPRDARLSPWGDNPWTSMFLDPRPSPQPPVPKELIQTTLAMAASGFETLVPAEVGQEKTTKRKGAKRLKLGLEKRKILDEAFDRDPYPAPTTRKTLGGLVGMAEKQVRSWFNNARARRPCKCKTLYCVFSLSY
jgi:hypothetical protein